MPKSLAQLQVQIAKLQQEAETVRAKEVAGVVARIRQAIDAYGLTVADLFGSIHSRAVSKKRGRKNNVARKTSSLTGRRVPIKYKDSEGNTWTGRGNKPRWLAAALAEGKKLESFSV